MVPFSLIIMAAVGFTGYIGYRGGLAAVSQLVEDLHAEVTAVTFQQLDGYLSTPHLINGLNSDAIETGELDIKDADALRRHFMAQIRRFDSVRSIAYADGKAEFVRVKRLESGVDFEISVSGKATGFTRVNYGVDAEGNRLEKASGSEAGFDPRLRPWYLAGTRANGPAWSSITMWSSGEVGLDAVLPVRGRSGLQGILEVALPLYGFERFLRGLDVLQHGQLFIVERNGLLVACSSISEPFIRSGGEFARISAPECDDPVVRTAADHLLRLPGGLSGIGEALRFRFDFDGERFFSQVTPYSDSRGLDWLVVTLIPESELMVGITAHTVAMEGIVAVSLVACLLFAVLAARWVTRPIHKLIESIKGVASGSWAGRIELKRRDEIGDLARSFNDMNERLQATFASLKESEEKFRVLSEQSHIGVCIVQGGRVHYMNRTFKEATGWLDMADMRTGFPDMPQQHPGSTLIAEMEKLSRKSEDFADTVQGPDLHLKTSNGDRWYSVFLKTVHLSGKPAGMAALVDITEEKAEREKAMNRQKQLIQAEKLASLGVLVAGVAHEINSPNQAILLSSQVVKDAWPQLMEILEEYKREHGDFLVGGAWFSQMSEMIPNCLEAIGKSSGRIEAIVTDLKEYARHDPTEAFRAVDLNLAVTSALALTAAMLKKHTRNLTVELAPDLPPVQGSFQRLEQVIVNLIQNACQALPDPSRAIRVYSRFNRAMGVIEFEVADEGVGIPEEDLPKLRDPFFTTKRETGGTGLGLPVSSTIIEQHGGRMEFRSRPGKGTTVVVILPALTA